jgi:hypothetical protein
MLIRETSLMKLKDNFFKSTGRWVEDDKAGMLLESLVDSSEAPVVSTPSFHDPTTFRFQAIVDTLRALVLHLLSYIEILIEPFDFLIWPMSLTIVPLCLVTTISMLDQVWWCLEAGAAVGRGEKKAYDFGPQHKLGAYPLGGKTKGNNTSVFLLF